jgi:hypothetical protein
MSKVDYSPISSAQVMELYLHSPTSLHGTVLNYISTGITGFLFLGDVQDHTNMISHILRAVTFIRSKLRQLACFRNSI